MATIEQAPPPPGLTPDPTPGPTPGQPARVLGLFDATCIVVGAIIGVGIFFNPSQVARLAHTSEFILLAWAVAGLIALCGALAFAALGRRYHDSGAQYQILRDAYSPLPAFVFVFCNSTIIQPGSIAIIATICAQNLTRAVSGEALQGWALTALSALLILSLAAANTVGVRWGSRIQNLTVLSKLATLLAITAIGVLMGNAPDTPVPMGTPPPEAPSSETLRALPGLFAALVPCFFAYGGWQHALWISGEVRDPRRNLPRAILGGVALVVAVYLLANWAYLKLLGPIGMAETKTLAADAASVALHDAGARIIAGAVAISAFGVLNAQFLSGPRLVFGMASDGRFFRPFARLHARFGTPTAAIFLLGAFALALLAVAAFSFDAVDFLVTGVVAVDSVFFGLTGAALLVLGAKAGKRDNPLRSLGYPLAPLLFVVGELGVVAGSFMDPTTRKAALIGAAWIAVATALYLVRFRAPRTH
ncbi:MAG: amino acid permease [Phycisphaerales bacterium]|nr:amino acid permease [Phycisphaerales bacterium]